MRHVKPFMGLVVAGLALLAGPPPVRAHCDTMDGPVIKDARAALASRDVTPVLKWVKPEAEAEIRQGEGAPYTGLKEAGTPVDPGIAAVDRALDTGSVDALARLLTAKAEQGLRARFDRVAQTRADAATSVERGRDYVAAYVELTHYAERLHADAAASTHGTEDRASTPAHHH